MNYLLSNIGSTLAGESGIGELMDDLGNALASGTPDLIMLGGGQPAQIPAINAIWKNRLKEITEDPHALHRLLTIYDPPQGNPAFIQAIAKLFQENYSWPITAENICLTSGGQTAFFYLFNLLAGKMPDGSHRKILFPLVPEYIGYAAQSLTPDSFRAIIPRIEILPNRQFKYHINFDQLQITPDIAALCVSRPTNPTGNVLSHEEMQRLSSLASDHHIPLIIDNAYGAPFPNIIFTDALPIWDEHIILTLSLSKLGLPGTRTGIVIAPPEIIRALSSMTAITGLANPSTGQQITLPLIHSGEILRISQELIRPFYYNKSIIAQALVREIFAERFPYYIHRSEGALFLWLWFPELKISCAELYSRLKRREVLIIPGHHFFFGSDTADWDHSQQCIRVSFACDVQSLTRGLKIIAHEIECLHQ